MEDIVVNSRVTVATRDRSDSIEQDQILNKKNHEILEKAKYYTEKFLDTVSHVIDDGHTYQHAVDVINNGINAIKYDKKLNLVNDYKLAILLACLLHDVDDRKFFDSKFYDNAFMILKKTQVEEYIVKLVIEMIDLVSCSKNKNNTANIEKWKLIPRDADRILAIETRRAYIYTFSNKGTNVLFTEKTPLPLTMSELNKEIAKHDLNDYRGSSDSMLDHYYDKIFHIHKLSSGNEYLQNLANKRNKAAKECVLKINKWIVEYIITEKAYKD